MERKQILVVGLGRFGSAVAESLFDLGHEVVAVDADERAVERVADRVTHALIADATDEEALQKLGIGAFDVVVISIGANLEAGILATVAAKGAGARHVISKATSLLAARVLASVGADEVVRPEHDMGVRLAQQLSSPGIVDAFDLGEHHGVVEVEAGGRLHGTLQDLRLPDRFGVQVIAVNRRGDLTVGPRADFEVRVGDRLVVIGANEAIDRLRAKLGG